MANDMMQAVIAEDGTELPFSPATQVGRLPVPTWISSPWLGELRVANRTLGRAGSDVYPCAPHGVLPISYPFFRIAIREE